MKETLLILLSVITLGYTVPLAIAFIARKDNRWAIAAFNLFLGWTFLGWILALVWALTKDK